MKKLSSKKEDVADPRLTPTIKRKTFSVYQKNYLYYELKDRSETKKNMEQAEKDLSLFVSELIKDYLYPEDLSNYLGKINEKLYKPIPYITISLKSFGLNNDINMFTYTKGKGSSVSLGPNHCIHIREYKLFDIPGNRKKLERDGEFLYKSLVEKGCPEEKLIVLTNLIEKHLICICENSLYLEKEPIRLIRTWGALYKKNKDWFDIVYKQYYKSKFDKKDPVSPKTIEDKLKELDSLVD